MNFSDKSCQTNDIYITPTRTNKKYTGNFNNYC